MSRGAGGGVPFFVVRGLADVSRHTGLVASRRYPHFFFFFSPLTGGCCPASGLGRLRGERQGAGACAAPCPLRPPTPRWAAIPDGQHDYTGNALCPLPAAWQRAFGLPLSRAHAGRASVRRRSFRPFRGGDLLRALPRLRWETSRSPFFPIRGQPSPHAGRNGFPLLIPCTVPERRCW